MLPVNRVLSSVLLASGIVLAFAGLRAALGFTVPGLLASVAVIAALLYGGSLWFGPPPAVPAPAGGETVIVFDRELCVAAGPGTGSTVLARFPAALRPEIELRCRAALRGESARFVCAAGDVRLVVETAPLASVTGVVLYGTLITSEGISAPSLAPRPISPMA